MKTTTLTISNPISDSLLRCALILIPFVLICVATLPGAHAVVPAPDGGYPNFNTAEGQSALFSLTTGSCQHGSWLVFAREPYHRQLQHRCRRWGPCLNTGDENTAFGAGALLLQHHRLRQHGQWSVRSLSTTPPASATRPWVTERSNNTGPVQHGCRCPGALSQHYRWI